MNDTKTRREEDKPGRDNSVFIPELYVKHNDVQRLCNLATLQLFQHTFERDIDPHQQFLDLGCGTGDFTLQELLPLCQPCRRIVAIDSSAKMIQYAEENFPHPQIAYEILDIRDDVSTFVDKYGKFDRIYSFYTIHWVKDHHAAFKNISDLMTSDGECLLLFAARLPVYDVWRRIVKMDRWKGYAELIESCIPQTHDMEDRKALISHMLNVLEGARLKPLTCEVMGAKANAARLDQIIERNMAFVPILSLLPEENKNTFKEDFANEIRRYWTEKCSEGRNRSSESYLIHAVKV